MNVLVLTPDRVGSTLLQRMITVYMQFMNFDQPVINLHELTNGLELYHNEFFNQDVLGRAQNTGYHQTLPEILSLLQQVEHYKTSRLARYHIRNRCDSIADQLQFYNYLNNNFFIISARRQNLFEHALSWCIFVNSRKLNVYTHLEKIQTFAGLFEQKIKVERLNLIRYLDEYVEYLDWCQRHFTINSYFHYEQDLVNLENYILNLPIFKNQKKQLSWFTNFGVDFRDWNKCHYLCSNISALTLLDESTCKTRDTKEITLRTVSQALSVADQSFIAQNGTQYLKSHNQIKTFVDQRILPTNIPIKLQTLIDKRMLIENWDQVLDWYNQWCYETNAAKPYSPEDLAHQAITESRNYHVGDQQFYQKKDGVQLEFHDQANVQSQA